MSKVYAKLLLGLFAMGISVLGFAQVSVTATAGTTGPTAYTTVKAAFDAINAGTHTGAITITVSSNTTETATAQLVPSGSGTASFTSVILKPAASTNPVITGSLPNGVLLVNASNFTIDGSNNGTNSRNLTISNTDTAGKLAAVTILNVGTTPATGVTIKNLITVGGRVGLYFAALTNGNSITPGYFTNPVIQNNSIQKTKTGIYMVGNTTTPSITGANISGNALNNTGANAIFRYGIQTAGLTNGTITGNLIGNFEASENGDDIGIYLSTATTNTVVDKNIINNLGHSGTGGYGGWGVLVITGTANNNLRIANNFISGLFGDGYDYTDPQFPYDNPTGILLIGNAQSGISIVYNTIVLTGATLNQELSASYGVYADAGSTFTLQNNIITNTLTNTATNTDAYATIGVRVAASSQITSNFNDIYVAGAGSAAKYIGMVGTSTYATLAAWQTATGQDANSKSVLPVFVSATDLHLVPASNLTLDNAGTPVANVTVDIDNDPRSASTPDIGADEFVGSTTDINPPSITYNALATACATTDRTLTVTIVDATGVAQGTTAPRIYYRKSTQTTFQSAAGTLSSGSATNGTWTFTISSAALGGVAVGDQIQYYVVAQDVVTTPNVGSSPSGVVAANVNTITTAPTTLNSYTVGAQITGTVTVGTGGTYSTLTAAAAAYNAGCLNGALTFSLTAATYNTGETFPIVLNNSSASATNTLTIKPASGITPTITGNTTTAMIQINGGDYITIDGSNTANGTTRDLTITTTATTGIPLVWISSNGTTNGATNNTVKNVKFIGLSASTTAVGIVAGGATVGAFAEAANNNNTVTNNSFTKMQNAMFITGPTASPFDQNWTITNNQIGSVTATADTLSYRGVYMSNSQTFNISGNTVVGVRTSDALPQVGVGIYVAGNSTGGTIANNRVRNIHNNNPAGYGAAGIFLASSNTTANITVQNNMISDVVGKGFAGFNSNDNGYGIMIGGTGAGYNVYYNTVNMDSSQTATTSNSAAFNIDSTVTATGAVRLQNNILVNTQTAAIANRYAIINRSTAGTAVFAAINNNVYYTTGANLGRAGTTNVAALSGFATAFGGNTNSVSVAPVFVSNTDLHLVQSAANSGIDNKGTPITGITVDIDAQTRSTTTPDPGADEFTSNPTAVVEISNPDVVSMTLMPNVVNDRTTIRVVTRKAVTMQWNVVDANGRTVMTVSRKLNIGRNDIQVEVSSLSAGYYQVIGSTEAGKAGAVTMIKQ